MTIVFLGYADMDPFGAARFRRSPRVLQADLTIFKGETDARGGFIDGTQMFSK